MQKERVYPCPFPLEQLKKEIKFKGKKITQIYLPKKLIPEISKSLKFRINFEPFELRLRKINKDYFLTIKSKGGLKREEFEKKVSKQFFEEYSKFGEKIIEKRRLKKYFEGHKLEFNYYPKYGLITAEIEFKTKFQAEKFKTYMREITGIDQYKNINLAR